MKNIVKINVEKKCENFIDKFLGLMFSRSARTTLFVNEKEEKIMIHTFFVFFPIDVYWLDSDKIIVAKETMNPFSVSKCNTAKYVLETASGLIKADIGDRIEF